MDITGAEFYSMGEICKRWL